MTTSVLVGVMGLIVASCRGEVADPGTSAAVQVSVASTTWVPAEPDPVGIAKGSLRSQETPAIIHSSSMGASGLSSPSKWERDMCYHGRTPAFSVLLLQATEEHHMTAQTRGRVSIEPTAKRVRARIAGVVIADSTDVLMVWEAPYYPTYYFPRAHVRTDLFTDSGETKRSPSRGTARLHDITVGDRTAQRAARVWDDVKIDELAGYVSFEWNAMDQWFEEDEEVTVHARNPYTRIDILESSRLVRVEIDGVEVARTDRARFLFETGLPTRYYIPKTDVDFTILTPTDTVTRCPYKGTARYWAITVGGTTYDDLAWAYDAPVKESADISGLVGFYNEKLDIYVDDVLQDRPRTHFS